MRRGGCRHPHVARPPRTAGPAPAARVRRERARPRSPRSARPLGAQLGSPRPHAVPVRRPRAPDHRHAVRRDGRSLRLLGVRATPDPARGPGARIRHRGGARGRAAAADRGMPVGADAAVRGAVPDAVHRRRPRQRRGHRRAGVRPAQLGPRGAARDRARRAPARRSHRDPRRTRPAARRVGGSVRHGREPRQRASGRGRGCRDRRRAVDGGRRGAPPRCPHRVRAADRRHAVHAADAGTRRSSARRHRPGSPWSRTRASRAPAR